MKTKVAKWGNSYAIRLPKHVVEELEITDTSELLLVSQERGFTVTKLTKEDQLADLLATMQPVLAVDWGDARGKEIW